MLENLTQYLFRHAILWELFLYQSDATFCWMSTLLILYIHIRARLLLVSIVLQMHCLLERLSLFKCSVMIYDDFISMRSVIQVESCAKFVLFLLVIWCCKQAFQLWSIIEIIQFLWALICFLCMCSTSLFHDCSLEQILILLLYINLYTVLYFILKKNSPNYNNLLSPKSKIPCQEIVKHMPKYVGC